jgi:hypothetical protein
MCIYCSGKWTWESLGLGWNSTTGSHGKSKHSPTWPIGALTSSCVLTTLSTGGLCEPTIADDNTLSLKDLNTTRNQNNISFAGKTKDLVDRRWSSSRIRLGHRSSPRAFRGMFP